MQKRAIFAKAISLFYMLRLRKLARQTGSQIPIRTIGKALSIWHWGAIIINESTTVGDYCTIRPGVVIGHKYEGGGCPKIGNNV